MPNIELSDDLRDRIDALQAELESLHAGTYASVETDDVLAYLLDLADAVDDPERRAEPGAIAEGGAEVPDGDGSGKSADRVGRDAFPTEALRTRLEARNRKHGDPDEEPTMDLYSIAAEYEIAGRSEMTKSELVDAILEAVERLYANPLEPIDVDLDAADPTTYADVDETNDGGRKPDAGTDDSADVNANESASVDEPASANDGGAGQLSAMMSLLDTHADKWREGDGDARYEVDLPDGGVETARTKDDVRAILFKKY